MSRSDVENQALELMRAGCNCAESVLQTAIVHFDLAAPGCSSRIATGFGGGLGRTHEELCGALAGAIMAIGLALGRDKPETSGDAACFAAAAFRARFLECNGATTCRVLLSGFGQQDNWDKCRRLVALTAGDLYDQLSAPRATA